MTTRKQTIVDIVPGRLTTITIAHSEACMHMGVAGKQMQIRLLLTSERVPLAQLYKDGEPFSFPILGSEAGVHERRDATYYAYLLTDEQA